MILRQDKGVLFAVSSRPENMSLNCGDTTDSLNNRKRFLDKVGINYRNLVCAKQVHSANVVCVEEKDKDRGALSPETALEDADALITNRRNLPLAVFTADCLSVFLYDLAARVIGVVHAGWKSSKENIASQTVSLMRKEFDVHPQKLYAFFGPALRVCCNEVSEEFNGYFKTGVNKEGKGYYLDLIAVNRQQLIDSGLSRENISDCGECTSCHSGEYFSYRREKETAGRMMSVIMLR